MTEVERRILQNQSTIMWCLHSIVFGALSGERKVLGDVLKIASSDTLKLLAKG